MAVMLSVGEGIDAEGWSLFIESMSGCVGVRACTSVVSGLCGCWFSSWSVLLGDAGTVLVMELRVVKGMPVSFGVAGSEWASSNRSLLWSEPSGLAGGCTCAVAVIGPVSNVMGRERIALSVRHMSVNVVCGVGMSDLPTANSRCSSRICVRDMTAVMSVTSWEQVCSKDSMRACWSWIK